uniref:Putative secreted protein n=1 Tax=Anopheles triannulatus TaxID=58253 RepID=A0A2M4B6Q5_9DIPT
MKCPNQTTYVGCCRLLLVLLMVSSFAQSWPLSLLPAADQGQWSPKEYTRQLLQNLSILTSLLFHKQLTSSYDEEEA